MSEENSTQRAGQPKRSVSGDSNCYKTTKRAASPEAFVQGEPEDDYGTTINGWFDLVAAASLLIDPVGATEIPVNLSVSSVRSASRNARYI
jgi:hypothetical protein